MKDDAIAVDQRRGWTRIAENSSVPKPACTQTVRTPRFNSAKGDDIISMARFWQESCSEVNTRGLGMFPSN